MGSGWTLAARPVEAVGSATGHSRPQARNSWVGWAGRRQGRSGRGSPGGTHGYNWRVRAAASHHAGPLLRLQGRAAVGVHHTLASLTGGTAGCRRVGMRLRLAAGGMNVPLLRRPPASGQAATGTSQGPCLAGARSGAAPKRRRHRPPTASEQPAAAVVCAHQRLHACLPRSPESPVNSPQPNPATPAPRGTSARVAAGAGRLPPAATERAINTVVGMWHARVLERPALCGISTPWAYTESTAREMRLLPQASTPTSCCYESNSPGDSPAASWRHDVGPRGAERRAPAGRPPLTLACEPRRQSLVTEMGRLPHCSRAAAATDCRPATTVWAAAPGRPPLLSCR